MNIRIDTKEADAWIPCCCKTMIAWNDLQLLELQLYLRLMYTQKYC
jgi:hypothetical protein